MILLNVGGGGWLDMLFNIRLLYVFFENVFIYEEKDYMKSIQSEPD